MGRATDPGENHDPGKDQRFTPSLTQEPRLENGLGHVSGRFGVGFKYRFGSGDEGVDLLSGETGEA